MSGGRAGSSVYVNMELDTQLFRGILQQRLHCFSNRSLNINRRKDGRQGCERI